MLSPLPRQERSRLLDSLDTLFSNEKISTVSDEQELDDAENEMHIFRPWSLQNAIQREKLNSSFRRSREGIKLTFFSSFHNLHAQHCSIIRQALCSYIGNRQLPTRQVEIARERTNLSITIVKPQPILSHKPHQCPTSQQSRK